MKICPSCKQENRDEAVFCTNCGVSLKEVSVQSEAWDAAGEIQDHTSGSVNMPQGKNSPFVDQSETVVASIGSSYLQNFLSGGGVGKGIGILTQKRFYYKGKNFSGSGKQAVSTTTEGVVALKDITYTEFNYTRHIGFLIAAILLTLVAATIYLLEIRPLASMMMCCFVAALVFYVLFFVIRRTIFSVCFAGGCFGFNIHYYPIADFRDFQRQLHLLKDQLKNG